MSRLGTETVFEVLSRANSLENINQALDRRDVAVRQIERKPACS
jgi:hypothetical protein